MRVLAHIHTMNDAAVIDQALEALRRQTRPPDAILIVDNASSDETLDRDFAGNVTIIRNSENLGTSGTVRTGFSYGLEHGFDWVWVFDADGGPEPEALENLLAFFEDLPPGRQEQVCFLAAWPLTAAGQIKERPLSLAGAKMEFVPVTRAADSTECDCTLWSGSLFRLAAVARIGLPTADYVLDIAEIEYGYRARQLGFTSYLVHNSVVHHDVGREAGTAARTYKLGRLRIGLSELSPIRCYYSQRNIIYFWLYNYKPRHMDPALRAIVRALVFTFGFVVRPISHRRQLSACIRGIWDGLMGHMERRY